MLFQKFIKDFNIIIATYSRRLCDTNREHLHISSYEPTVQIQPFSTTTYVSGENHNSLKNNLKLFLYYGTNRPDKN